MRALILKIYSTIKRFIDLNNRPVCASYSQQDIECIALFWSLDSELDVNPQTRIESLIWGRIVVYGAQYILGQIPFDSFCNS